VSDTFWGVVGLAAVKNDFEHATHTVVLSDIHLADAEPPHPHIPLWKRFKNRDLFIDGIFKDLLEYLEKEADSPIELILNGDIFDFDSVMVLPKNPPFHVSWLEKKRGLRSEEAKSQFKFKIILRDHAEWVNTLGEFVRKGNRIVIVIGNHDIELHWPSVQAEFIDRLGLTEEQRSQIRFVEWFYISNHDTLIEHGNQYDAYCLCSNPVNPVIKNHKGSHVRLPFGNLAGHFMLNGMGLMNPHAESSYIRNSALDYMKFYYKYVIRTQPLLIWTWFWSALVTLVVSVSEGFRPAMTDPLTIADRIETVGHKANSNSRVVLALRALHAHPAYFNPLQILQELWLDRAILFGLVVFVSFQFFSFLNVFVNVSIWWFIVPFAVLLPVFIFYARSVHSDVEKTQKAAFAAFPIAAKITGVSRVIHGHTHLEDHFKSQDIEYLNTGTWSPAFHDVECTQPFGKKCFAWIKPGPTGSGARVSELYEWKDSKPIPMPVRQK
jgi:UDP-2,3-diacylglucosamine pyrophosphatase LpxH